MENKYSPAVLRWYLLGEPMPFWIKIQFPKKKNKKKNILVLMHQTEVEIEQPPWRCFRVWTRARDWELPLMVIVVGLYLAIFFNFLFMFYT